MFKIWKISGKKLVKVLKILSAIPRYSGLAYPEIETLSNLYGIKVWQSYLENNKPSAGRIFWVYDPNKLYISIMELNHTQKIKRRVYTKLNSKC